MSHTKHFFQSSDGLVAKSLRASVSLNPQLRLHAESKSVYRYPSESTNVAVISGGGAGHEPAHAGYTGKGMLQASVCGDIFASPSAKQIYQTMSLTNATNILVIINNYTGDRLNFGLAIEKARADGWSVESVVVADDVALVHQPSLVGPRGLAGNILVCKILGAYAERGGALHAIKLLGDAVVRNLASIGVGMEHCHVPGRAGNDVLALGTNECELGLGLHSEAGAKRRQLPNSPVELVQEMFEMIQNRSSSAFLQKQDESVLFLNNLGGISQLEMGALLSECLDYFENNQFRRPTRIYMSSYMTSLNVPGFSISCLNLTSLYNEIDTYPNVLVLLDDPTDAIAWNGACVWPDTSPPQQLPQVLTKPVVATNTDFWRNADISTKSVENGIVRACHAVLELESTLTEYDSIVGDGDCGETFASGANGVIQTGGLQVAILHPSELVKQICDILEDKMGGTIGALFAIFFTAWSTSLVNAVSAQDIAQGMNAALRALAKHTPAKPGDRTIMDALTPFCQTLGKGNIRAAVDAAKSGAEKTENMPAILGRAVYTASSSKNLPPDPGAIGVAEIVKGFYRGFHCNDR